MATIPTTAASAGIDGQFRGVVSAAWAAMQNGDDGKPVNFAAFRDKSFQVEGTFGAGGTVAIEGSNDGVNYRTLHDPQGVALAITQAKIVTVLEATLLVRPRVTGGDGTTSLNVTAILCRGGF